MKSFFLEEKPVVADPGIFRDIDVGDGTKPPRFDLVLKPAVKVTVKVPWGFSKHYSSIHKVNSPGDAIDDKVDNKIGWFGPSRPEKELYNEKTEHWFLPGFYRFKFDDKVSDVLLQVREGDKGWEVDFFKDPPTVTREPATMSPVGDTVPGSR
jgi:hypothetical protein